MDEMVGFFAGDIEFVVYSAGLFGFLVWLNWCTRVGTRGGGNFKKMFGASEC